MNFSTAEGHYTKQAETIVKSETPPPEASKDCCLIFVIADIRSKVCPVTCASRRQKKVQSSMKSA
jgi:hypothetical protein